MARTTGQAHKRIDEIEPRITKLETVTHIQFKDKRIDEIEPRITKLETLTNIQFKEGFARIKRLEAILIGSAGTIITMLLMILSRME